MAPLRVLFCLDSPLVTARPDEYIAFLEALRAEAADPQGGLALALPPGAVFGVNLLAREEAGIPELRYHETDATGHLYASPRVFTLRFQGRESAPIAQMMREAAEAADALIQSYGHWFRFEPEALSLAFYDNTIAILSVELPLEGDALEWTRLEEWSACWVYQLMLRLYPRHLFPFLQAVERFSASRAPRFALELPRYRMFLYLVGDPDQPRPDLHERFLLMWVRLIWLRREGERLDPKMQIAASRGDAYLLGETKLCLQMRRSLVLSPALAEKETLGPLWEAMALAEYYCAALDVIGLNLAKYIGLTFNQRTSRALRQLKSDMEIVFSTVATLEVKYQDACNELRGETGALFEHLCACWRIDRLAGRVTAKLALCKGNIDTLHQEASNRNEEQTEMVLLALAGLGILNLMVELSSYAVQVLPESRYMLGSFPGFMSLGFTLSHNTLSWIGIALSLMVVSVTIWRRRR